MLRSCPIVVLVMFASLSPSAAAQAEWGHFKARFVVDGKVPAPAAIAIPAGIACGVKAPVNESLIVSKEGGLKNVVVFLQKPPAKDVPIHKDYAAMAKAKVDLGNAGCRFEPHISTLWNVRTLHVTNSDKFGHNTKIDTFNNPGVNPIVPAGGFIDLDFKKSENLPMPVACNIHPWMSAQILILDHPYMTVSDDDGNIDLQNIPAGEWTFVAWHERLGRITKPTVEGKPAAWEKGRFPVVITADQVTDLGTAELTPAQLKVVVSVP
jgi:hypothetical protein